MARYTRLCGRLVLFGRRRVAVKPTQWVCPSEDLLVDQRARDEREDGEGDEAKVPVIPVLVALDQGCDSQGNHTHEFDEDVQRGPRSVLEGIADSVTHHTSLPLIGLL